MGWRVMLNTHFAKKSENSCKLLSSLLSHKKDLFKKFPDVLRRNSSAATLASVMTKASTHMIWWWHNSTFES